MKTKSEQIVEALMPQFDFIFEKCLIDMPYLDLAQVLNNSGFYTLSGKEHCQTSAKALLKSFYKEIKKAKHSILDNIKYHYDVCATKFPLIIKHGKGNYHLFEPVDGNINLNKNIIVVPNCSSILYIALFELLSHKKIIYWPQENPDIRVVYHLQDGAPILDLPVCNKRLMKTNNACWLAAIFIINEN